MKKITFDEWGYPTEEWLEYISSYSPPGGWNQENALEFLRYVSRGWWASRILYQENSGYVFLSTGGWSGNEDIIDALKKNTTFWEFAFTYSEEGGLFAFLGDKNGSTKDNRRRARNRKSNKRR